ncbi:MAG: hypothetical protein RLP44_12825 [Aggregatilineales bacterium]
MRNDEDILNANYFFTSDGTWLAVMHSDYSRFVLLTDEYVHLHFRSHGMRLY